MSSAALAARGNWQAGANQGGAAHEMNVEKIFTEYFATEEGTNYEFISKPKILDQVFLEEDYKKNPGKYVKPAEPKKGDTYYEAETKRFFEWTGRKWGKTRLGMTPDAMIRNYVTGKCHLLEDKNQGPRGNAHERACRYGMTKMENIIREKLGVTGQPVSWIFAGEMTVTEKYILEIQATFPDDHVLLVKPTDNAKEVIITWFNRVIRPLLED
jgi:hypothetical protein